MICAIVLAAGQSRRMGCQKLLLPFGGQTVLARIVDEVLRSSIAKLFVVVGRDGAAICQTLAGHDLAIVTNPIPHGAMLSSVRCGLQALPPECDAILLVLGDQPALTSNLIDALLRAYRAAGRGILVPCHHGRRGHPLLFSARYRADILVKYDDRGLRGLLEAHPEDVVELNVADASVLQDLDYPEDYRQALAKTAAGGEPACQSSHVFQSDPNPAGLC